MKQSQIIFLLFLPFLFSGSCDENGPQKSVLVFSKTTYFRHESIPEGIEAIKQLGRKNGFEVYATEDSTFFTKENLRNFSVVIFLNTTFDVLNDTQQADFEQFIQAGGGFVGIHSATDTEFGWPWYGDLVGAHFKDHPPIQKAEINVVVPDHPATEMLPERWIRTDE